METAVAQKVDLVAVAGDLVDQANRYLEAVGPLESGLKKLVSAGIQTIVVAGNHDHDVLTDLADSIGPDAIRLLGRHGTWERFTWERGGVRVHLDGWSFPQSRHWESPLRTYRPMSDGAPVLALLHADLDQPGSPYAPISLPELRRHPEVTFLLGHVHHPRRIEEPGGARFLYPGSPQAMDPGEPGKHGVWLLRLDGHELDARQLPLSTVRYETVEVSVAGIERPEDVDGRVFRTLRDHLTSLAEETDTLACVRYRVRLTGATRFLRTIEERLAELAGEFELPMGSSIASIDSIGFEMSPAHDLDGLATGLGAPAVVANLLRHPELDPGLRADLYRAVAELQGSRSFVEVGGDEDDLAGLERISETELKRAAAILLDELLLQRAAVNQ